jgi:hypothetical protein
MQTRLHDGIGPFAKGSAPACGREGQVVDHPDDGLALRKIGKVRQRLETEPAVAGYTAHQSRGSYMRTPKSLLRELVLVESAVSAADVAVGARRAAVERLLRQHCSSEAAFAELEMAERRLANLSAIRDAILANLREDS